MALPSIFQGLNDIDAATAKRRFRQHRAAHGEVVMRAGETSRGLVIVDEGRLEIVVDGTVVGEAGPGQMVGEMGLFIDEPRTATVQAPQGAVLWMLEREGYEELRDTIHPICIAIELATINGQVRRLNDVGERVVRLGLGVPVAAEPPSGFFAAVQRLFGLGDLTRVDADPLEALGASQLFEGAPWPAVEQIGPWFTPYDAKPGAFLCTEGETGDRMFILQSGAVEVVASADGQPLQVATLAPGAAFGMVSLAGRGTRMSSCVAREKCRVHALDQNGWHSLVNEPYMVGSTFRRAVIRAFSDQLRYSNNQLAAWEQKLAGNYGLDAIRQAQRGLTSYDRALLEE